MQYAADRRDIQYAVLKHRRGTHRTAGTKLPDRSFRRTCPILPLASRAGVIFEQGGPVSGISLSCFRRHHSGREWTVIDLLQVGDGMAEFPSCREMSRHADDTGVRLVER